MTATQHEQQAEGRSSIKLTRNAKGDTQIEVKIRVGDTDAEIDNARQKAIATYNDLRAQFS